jgi:hypothetical protein
MNIKNADMPAMPSGNVDTEHKKEYEEDERFVQSNGLTKREHIAAMAMQGLIAADGTKSTSIDSIVDTSVRHADALLIRLEDKL